MTVPNPTWLDDGIIATAKEFYAEHAPAMQEYALCHDAMMWRQHLDRQRAYQRNRRANQRRRSAELARLDPATLRILLARAEGG